MPLPFLRSQRSSKAAYETWLRIAGPDTARRRPWSEMDDDERLIWEEVARAVVRAWRARRDATPWSPGGYRASLGVRRIPKTVHSRVFQLAGKR